jgi:hypothetical protein
MVFIYVQLSHFITLLLTSSILGVQQAPVILFFQSFTVPYEVFWLK